MAPVAAEIIAGRPPAKAITVAMQKEAYRPILGATPAMMEKAIASGMRASATTSPASTSRRTLENHYWRKDVINMRAEFLGTKPSHPPALQPQPSKDAQAGSGRKTHRAVGSCVRRRPGRFKRSPSNCT